MNAIVIGLGPHGQRILQAVRQSSHLNIVGVVDLSQDVLDSLDVEENQKFTSLEKALAELPIDLASIATNGPSHAKLAIQCMKDGIKHVMVEKPLACSLEESLEMMEIAKAENAKLAVSHPRRFSKNYGLIREMIKNGELGEFRNIYIQRTGIGLGCLATHSFDLANFISGMTPKAVTAWVDVPLKTNPRGEQFVDPGGTVVLDYGNGKKGLISQIEDGAGPIFVEINLTAGRVHIDEKGDILEIIKRNLNVTKTPGKGAAYERIVNPSNIGGKRVLVDELQWLLEDLVISNEPASGVGCGYDSIEVLIAAYVSHENGHCPVSLPIDSKHHSKWLPVT